MQDFLIIGGGVIGMMTAWQLTENGLSVTSNHLLSSLGLTLPVRPVKGQMMLFKTPVPAMVAPG